MKLSHSVSRTEKFSTKLCVSIGDIRITYNELELYTGNPFKLLNRIKLPLSCTFDYAPKIINYHDRNFQTEKNLHVSSVVPKTMNHCRGA